MSQLLFNSCILWCIIIAVDVFTARTRIHLRFNNEPFVVDSSMLCWRRKHAVVNATDCSYLALTSARMSSCVLFVRQSATPSCHWCRHFRHSTRTGWYFSCLKLTVVCILISLFLHCGDGIWVVGWAAISTPKQQLDLMVTLTVWEWNKEFLYVECTEWLNREQNLKHSMMPVRPSSDDDNSTSLFLSSDSWLTEF